MEYILALVAGTIWLGALVYFHHRKGGLRFMGKCTDGEKEFEVGKDEAWFANIKRTYDEYQQESLETIKHMRQHFDKLVSDAQQFDNQRQTIANQALQNAVETANMVSKQSVRHSDLSIDRQWNVEPREAAGEAAVLRQVTLDDSTLKALSASIAIAVTQALGKKK